MDWGRVTLKPNLKFALELEDDLKRQYYERHDRAKQTLANFTCSLQNVCLEYQKILENNVELSIEGEKMKQIIKDCCSCNEKILNINNKPYSEVISASTNCNLEVTPKSGLNRKIDNIVGVNNIVDQKENICEFVPIYTEDFNSDIEDGCSTKNKSPPRPVVNSLIKVQNSPILSKSKRYSSKKSNSSLSNNSIASSNDSKVSLTPSKLDKSNDEIDNELDAKYEKKFDKEPLHGIENNICTPKSQNKSNKVLSVSKIDYGKTEFTDRGKKLRQSKLTLKKIVPVIDLSKVDSDENFNKKDSQSINDSSWTETFFNNEYINKNTSVIKESSCKKNLSDSYDKKEFETKNESTSPAIIKNLNQTYEEELIETSPAQSETSKLRNKLNMKKPEITKVKRKCTIGNNEAVTSLKNSKLWTNEHKNNKTDQNQYDLKNNFKCFSKPSTSKQNEVVKADELSQNSTGEKRKSFEGQKTLNDETYFSPAELTIYKKHSIEFDVDATDFEDELKNDSPPLKKMLLSSFDIIPGRKEKSPEYAYKEAPVRKKIERSKLPGWSCRDCERWYDHLPDEEKRKRQNECSRHRGKYKANNSTPESFWNPEFDNDGNSSSAGNY